MAGALQDAQFAKSKARSRAGHIGSRMVSNTTAAATSKVGDIYRITPKLWLVRNEVGGWTAMHPEDY